MTGGQRDMTDNGVAGGAGPRTLAIDVGGSGLKASVLDGTGAMVVPRVRVPTAELVITLGTGFGTALFADGRLCPHLELSQHPLRREETYDQQLGDAARRRVGNRKWNRRVRRAVRTLDALLFFDALYVGGGNASRVSVDLGSWADSSSGNGPGPGRP